MSEDFCKGETREDGVKICALHSEPLIGKAEAQAKGFTKGKPCLDELGGWWCPVTGSATGSFKVSDALHYELAEG